MSRLDWEAILESMQRDVSFRYMSVFHCIGPECEDHCCYRWRVKVDPDTYKRLKIATSAVPEERNRFRRAFKVQRESKNKTTYYIQMLPDEMCPMLDGPLCHIQLTYGGHFLPDVCAFYPRALRRIADHVELSATPSCPEVVRSMASSDDALDLIELDAKLLPRRIVFTGVDALDARPFSRLLNEARAFVLSLLRDPTLPTDKRFFFVTYFAKRTSEVLGTKVYTGDKEVVRNEIRTMADERVLAEIGRRVDEVETPSAIALMLARELARPKTVTRDDTMFGRLVREVFESIGWAGLLEVPPADSDHEAVWREYQRRRDAVRGWAGHVVDRHLVAFAANYLIHRLPLEAGSLLVFVLRMLTEMALQKLLIFGHPDVAAALAELEATPAEAQAERARQVLEPVVARVCVKVIYRTARYVEHSTLITKLEDLLQFRAMRSLAGALYLIRL